MPAMFMSSPSYVRVISASFNPTLAVQAPIIPTNIASSRGRTAVKDRSPDGDTIAIFVTDRTQQNHLKSLGVKFKNDGAVTVRLQDIDTLETHFGGFHQPRRFADGATDFMLGFSGVRDVVWDSGRTKITSAKEAEGVKLLVSGVDGYGRVIGYLVPAREDMPEGDVELTPELWDKTYNAHAIREKWAYPMFYADADGKNDLALLRHKMEVATAARVSGEGIYSEDVLLKGAAIMSVKDLENNLVLYPKIFRRLINYDNSGGKLDNMHGFLKYLANNPDPLLLFSAEVLAGHGVPKESNLHEVLEVETREDGKQYLKLTVPPEFLVFKPLHLGGGNRRDK